MGKQSFRPYSKILVTVTFLAAFAFVVISTKTTYSRFILSWAETNELLRDSILFAGPMVSVLSCLSGALHRTVAFSASPIKSDWKLIRARATPQLVAAVSGWIAGMLPLLIVTYFRATYGSIDIWVVFTTMLTWIIWVLGGYLCGIWIRFPLCLFVVIILGFSWFYLPSFTTTLMQNYGREGFSFLSLAPAWFDLSFGIGWQRSDLFALMSTFFLLSIILCLLFIGSKFKRWWIFFIPAALGVVMVSVQPDLVVKDKAEPVCREHNGINVCLHPAETVAFDKIYDGIDQAQANVDLAAMPNQLSDFVDTTESHSGLGINWRGSAKQITADTTSRIYDWSSGVWQCVVKANSAGTGMVTLSDEESLVELIQFSLANQLGLSDYLTAFSSEDKSLVERAEEIKTKISSWSPQETGAFVSKHSVQLRDCDLALINEF